MIGISLNVPKNYEQTIEFTVTTGEGATLNNVRPVYNDLDQPGAVKDPGVHVTLGNAVAQIGEKGTKGNGVRLQ